MSAARHDASSLFAAAREDGPDAGERDAVFCKVALATGIATGTVAMTTLTPGVAMKVVSSAPAAVASVTPAAAAFSIKALAIGAVLGALGTALAVLAATSLREPELALRVAETTVGSGDDHAARGQAVARGAQRGEARALQKEPERPSPSAPPAPPAPSPTSDLEQEARLVTAARSALVAGDPTLALAHIQATRKLGARALEPEELGLEARALRALGRADDAAATELVLRRRYPDSAFAR